MLDGLKFLIGFLAQPDWESVPLRDNKSPTCVNSVDAVPIYDICSSILIDRMYIIKATKTVKEIFNILIIFM